MSNIEKLLNALVSKNGDQIALKVGEPPYLVISGKSRTLSQNPLNGNDIAAMKEECKEVFDNAPNFNYNGLSINFTSDDTSIVFNVDNPESVSTTTNIKIDELLSFMLDNNASDLHLSTASKPILRIDGDMMILEDYPELTENDIWTVINQITPDKNIKEFKETNDSDYAYEIPELCRFRANIFRDNKGAGAVFRQIPFEILTPEVLNIPNAIIELCSLPKGLILVTGPTGSGKSTTLAAMIDHINRNTQKHIITVEDPVEFVHQNKKCLVNQREVGEHTQSFKKALRAALREDPDVILVGEMRDLETIAIAIEMAETGHLVMGTLHTNTAVGTVDRIIDQFPANQQNQIRTMLAESLIGVVSQMLCKRVEGGRVAVYETLICSTAVANLIRESKTFQIPSLMEVGKAKGMRLMTDSFIDLINAGTITVEEAM
ncbi:MAG: type IV pilus twitching motility protein PilT, partial [Candidatus Delongbacteria bacterium]|nr:type IV pilus twitching motility protein PilT [Candidatus Delongbacteria bacterium]